MKVLADSSLGLAGKDDVCLAMGVDGGVAVMAVVAASASFGVANTASELIGAGWRERVVEGAEAFGRADKPCVVLAAVAAVAVGGGLVGQRAFSERSATLELATSTVATFSCS